MVSWQADGGRTTIECDVSPWADHRREAAPTCKSSSECLEASERWPVGPAAVVGGAGVKRLGEPLQRVGGAKIIQSDVCAQR